MRANRKTDTKPEVALRSALHRAGLRFGKNRAITVDEGRAIRVDIVFPRRRLAVFVDGCFWHRCPIHGVAPTRNASYWKLKLDRNVERDRDVDTRLRDAGWTVLRYWEHESVAFACNEISTALRARREHVGRITKSEPIKGNHASLVRPGQ
jgi:DNA mismatch endonuclease (patch repair protein)